ncbi:hypothetical protein, partial [Rhodococcus sp. YH3-3]|uniref:hypothetical protein n=1 Tax=Rhodococcus sp. YH3-3 TaxID=1803579 RepID=UPI001EE74FB1
MSEFFRHPRSVNRFLRSVMKDVKPHSRPLELFHHLTDLQISISDPDVTRHCNVDSEFDIAWSIETTRNTSSRWLRYGQWSVPNYGYKPTI